MTTLREVGDTPAVSTSAAQTSKITVIHVRVSNYPGGVETWLLGLLGVIDTARFRPRLFFFQEPGAIHERSLCMFRDRGYTVELLPWGPYKNVAGAVRRLVAAVREQPNVVVHSHDTRSDLVAIIAARVCDVPVIISNHAWHAVGLKRNLHEAIRARMMRWADIVVNVSEDTHRETLRRGVPREKSTTAYLGVDLEPFRNAPSRSEARRRLGVPSDAYIVGNVARMWPEKAQHTLIDVASRLAADYPALMIVFVGDGPLESSLRSQAKALGLEDKIRFTGFLPDPTSVWGAFDAFALPSTAEGAPIVIWEAMALGQPIIASHVSGIGEVLEHDFSAILIPPADTDALSAAIRRLITEPATAARIGAAAKQVVESRFSIEKTVPKYENIYAKLVNGRDLEQETTPL